MYTHECCRNTDNRFGRNGTGSSKIELRIAAGSGALTNINNLNFTKFSDHDNIISYNYYYNNKKNNSLEVYCKLNFDTKNAGHCKFYTLYCNQSPSGLEFYSNVEYCTEKEGDIKSCILYYNKSNDKEDSYKTVN